MTTAQARFDFRRDIACPRPALWHHLTDPGARAAWGPAEGERLRFTAADTREGGRDVHLCGPGPDPQFEVTTLWHLLDAPARAGFTEVMRHQGRVLSAAQVDYALDPDGDGTQLAVTVWVSAFAGPAMLDGFDAGWASALDTLARHLEAPAKTVPGAPRAVD
ncbi:MAG: SRPBCC domain-containing protein [Paracoccaceae bacterium]